MSSDRHTGVSCFNQCQSYNNTLPPNTGASDILHSLMLCVWSEGGTV
uniref:Uncharacterized protein n=1 Tax=Mus musculus TaxID=10090 RepID=Q3V3P4_MOUSE|nr:unnamed protein product [Mus musculus]